MYANLIVSILGIVVDFLEWRSRRNNTGAWHVAKLQNRISTRKGG